MFPHGFLKDQGSVLSVPWSLSSGFVIISFPLYFLFCYEIKTFSQIDPLIFLDILLHFENNNSAFPRE